MDRKVGLRRDTEKARAFVENGRRSSAESLERSKRRSATKRGGSTLKQKQPKRDWSAARAKVEREEVCRLGRDGGCEGRLEAAHLIGRDRDMFDTDGYGPCAGWRTVLPVRIVPLCSKHHKAYDAHELDLLGCLTPEEEAQAVLDADGLEAARRRLAPLAYRDDLARAACMVAGARTQWSDE